MSEAILQEHHTRSEAAEPFRFQLLCHQRSGSNALAAILNADDRVHLYGQLFNPFWGYWRRHRRLGLTRYQAHSEALLHFGPNPPLRHKIERAAVAMTPRTTDLEPFMDTFWKNWGGVRQWEALGYKIHDYQVTDSDLAALATKHVDGTIMLWRKNRLKAAVSWAYAMKTDVWSRKGEAKGPLPVYELPIADLEWWMDKTEREVDNWRRVLNDSGACYLELTYEDSVRTRELKDVYDLLGLDYDGPPEFVTKKLASNQYAHVSNADEIEKKLGSGHHGHLFD